MKKAYLYGVLSLLIVFCCSCQNSNPSHESVGSALSLQSDLGPGTADLWTETSDPSTEDYYESSLEESIQGKGDSFEEYPRDFNRNQVKVEKYGIKDYRNSDGSINRGAVINEITEEQFGHTLNDNEIRLYMYDTGIYFVKTNPYSHSFSSVAPYDAEHEADYCINGSRISFTIPETGNSIGYNNLGGRKLQDEYDHAFVLKTIAQIPYVPYQSEKDYKAYADHSFPIRLAVSIDNECGIQDNFIVAHDLYVYHFEGQLGDLWTLRPSDMTEISTEPIPDEYFIRLYATAVRYLHTFREDERDVFGLFRCFRDYCPSIVDVSEELLIQCLIEKGELFLEYKGVMHQLENEDHIRQLIALCLGQKPFLGDFTTEAVLEVDSTKNYRKDGIRIYVMRDDEIKSEFYVGSDGRIRREYDEIWIASGYYGLQTLRMVSKAEFVSTHLAEISFKDIESLLDND